MTFEEILDQAIAMVQRRGRVTYQTLKLQFQLDEEHLEALKDAILFAYPQVVDAAGRGLVWSGDAGAISPPTSVSPQSGAPLVTLAPHGGTTAGCGSQHCRVLPCLEMGSLPLIGWPMVSTATEFCRWARTPKPCLWEPQAG